MKRYLLTLLVCILLLPALTYAQTEKAKYIFFFIGDGMGMGHVNTAETYNRDVLGATEPMLMIRFPYAGQVRTYSANSPITDSAAAATALATGEKTNNYMIAVGPDSTLYQSIANDLRQAGYRIGIASSVAGDDATPACFYALAYNRSDKYVIAPQAAKSHFSFLGAPVWKGMYDKDGKLNGWQNLMQACMYTIYHDPDSLISLPIDQVPYKSLLLAANPQGHQIGYTIDSIPTALTLPQMTRAALHQLEGSLSRDSLPQGFFLMVEAGNIDWAAHANDGGTVIKEILNFQQAIDVAYQFYLQYPEETLIVVTADHDTGGMTLGCRENRHPDLSLVDWQRISKDRFSDYCKARHAEGNAFTWPQMRKFLAEKLGFFSAVTITPEEETALQESFKKIFIENKGVDEKTLYNDFNRYAVEVYNLLNIKMGIGWTTPNHTGNPVPVYAIGAGAEAFGRNINNTEIPKLILKAACVKHVKIPVFK